MTPNDGASAIALLRDELRLAPGPVPAGATGNGADFAPTRDGFVLTVSPALRFRYRRGRGVRYAASGAIDAAAVEIFHHGSVHAAVAWMNGLVPLHASAVLLDGRVHAFAGVSGEGKSTLIAALGARGLRRFADDIVTLTIPADGPPLALPGHKRLKLWADAMKLSGQAGSQRVWPGLDKFYIEDAEPPLLEALPLASLTLLESGEPGSAMTIMEVTGAARMMALRDSCYRANLRADGRQASVFAQFATLAAHVPVFTFYRPRDTAQFDRGVDSVLDHIARLAA